MKTKLFLLCALLAIALVACAAPAATPVPPPPTAILPTPVPPTEANKALVRRYVEQVPNGGHLEVLDEMASPNYKRYLSAAAAPINAAANKQRLAGLRAVFPDLQITIDDMFAEGDRVVYRGTARGTQKVAFMGIPPSGKQVANTIIEIFRIENGKIAEHWGGPDTMDLVLQLGGAVSAAPAPTMPPFPIGTFTTNADAWEFKADGSYVLQGPRHSYLGTYTVTGNQIAFTGPPILCGDMKGTYTWTFDGKALSFKALDDQCGARQGVFEGSGAWTKQ